MGESNRFTYASLMKCDCYITNIKCKVKRLVITPDTMANCQTRQGFVITDA